MSSARSLSAAWLTRVLLLLTLLGFDWRGYWVYSREEAAGGVGPYLDLAHGIGPAPFQYRVGVLKSAYVFYTYLHFPFRYSFALFDAAASAIAVLLGYELLRRTSVFRHARASVQWLGSASYVALVLYMLAWQDVYKKNETESCAALAMLTFALWFGDSGTRREGQSPRGRDFLIAAAILVLTLLTSLLRADLALCLNLGFFAVAWMRTRGPLSLPRRLALATSAAGAALAVIMQALLIKVVYPHARHYDSAVFMLPHDIGHPVEVAQFLVYLAPTIWVALEARRRRFTTDAASLGLLFAAAPFVLLWMLLGRLEEVRIFLPMAVVLIPLGVQMIMLRAAEADALEPAPAP